MTTDDIIKAAKDRLDAIATERAALDAEERKLRRMLAAAEGRAEPVKTETLEDAVRSVGAAHRLPAATVLHAVPASDAALG